MTSQRRFAGRRRGFLPNIREHRTFAIVLAPLILGLGLTVQRLPDVLAGSAEELPVRLASLGLLVATLLYLASWFFGSYYELRAVERLGEDLLRYVPRSELPIIVGTATVLGFLGLASVNAVVFGALLFGIKAIELFSSWPLYNLVRRNAHDAEHPEPGEPGLSPGMQAGVTAVRTYYLERPWVQVTAIVMSLITASVGLAAFSAATPDRAIYVNGTVIASLGMMAAMALQEFRTWVWRMRYIRALDAAQRLDEDAERQKPDRAPRRRARRS